MRAWNLNLSDPYTLSLAADQRLTPTDYTNDQIWDLLLGSGDPASVLLQTSFGLRARNMRIFPRFIEKDNAVSAPADFETPVRIKKFHPNYIQLAFSPFAGIDAVCEFWVPQGQTLAGRIKISNHGVTPRKLRLELAALLNPSGKDGQAMTPVKREAVTILEGQTGDLAPVLFLTGGARGYTSPYAALIHELDLLPTQSRRFTWVNANLEDPNESFLLARSTAARNWDAEIACIEMTNAGQVEIHTGNPDWDAVLAFSQSTAYQLLLSPSEHLAHPSFVSARRPDQGYSPRGDGSDHGYLWEGQTAIETWYLTQLLLPGEPETAKGLLRNLLEQQSKDGEIDWKPGLAGQRARMLATPVLVSTAWRIYETSGDLEFLKSVFTALLNFIHRWFHERQDQDRDGIPEWDNSLQSGFDSNPSFSRWYAWSQAADMRYAESPDLCAMLLRECRLLIQMAEITGRREAVPPLLALSENLESALTTCWDANRATYQYWDRDTHQSQKGSRLAEHRGNGKIKLKTIFDFPHRLMLKLKIDSSLLPQAEIRVQGTLPDKGKHVEEIMRSQITWIDGMGTVTLGQVLSKIDSIEISGVPDDGKTSVFAVDHKIQDHTLLTPLWAKHPTPDRVKKIIQRKLQKASQYGRPYGIPAAVKGPAGDGAEYCEGTWLPWNMMIIEGLLAYDAQAEAVYIFSGIMAAAAATLKQEHFFRKHYHADTGKGMGERNILSGIPPAGLFLEILGVRIHSPWRVQVNGLNPYPWPVTLKFRGLRVEYKEASINITFPNGKSILITEPQTCIVDGNAIEIESNSNK